MQVFFPELLAQGDIDVQSMWAVVSQGKTWLIVCASFFVMLFFGHLFARSKVQRVPDPIRSAFHSLLGASVFTAILVFAFVLFTPSFGGNLSTAIGTAALALVVHILVAGLLFITDPARAD